MIQRYGVKTLNKNGIFLMIRELLVEEVHVRLWVGASAAPISCHPERDLRQHPHRKEEFDLVAALLPSPWTWDDIAKDPSGKPRLTAHEQHIGISHSNGLGCFAWSRDAFGIDIQTPHPSIFKVRTKYCHQQELAFLREDIDDSRYVLLWSAKEAIYKYFGHGVDFSHDLIAQPFESTDRKIFIQCQFQPDKYTTFIVHCIHEKDFILTIAQNSLYEKNT